MKMQNFLKNKKVLICIRLVHMQYALSIVTLYWNLHKAQKRGSLECLEDSNKGGINKKIKDPIKLED